MALCVVAATAMVLGQVVPRLRDVQGVIWIGVLGCLIAALVVAVSTGTQRRSGR